VQVDLYAQIGLQHYPLTQDKNQKKILMLEYIKKKKYMKSNKLYQNKLNITR